jgi:uncharacterized protein YggU (UPF0235/DUF167 family)
MAVLPVKVAPRSAMPGIGGWRRGSDGREELEIRVAQAPTDGVANEAVEKLLAKALGVSRSQVTITAGHSSRHKRLSVPFALEEVRERLGGRQGKDWRCSE